MNQERFDGLARSLATSRISRGRMLKMGATAALGSVLGRGGLLWPPGPSRGCSLDSQELECDFHIYAPPAQEAGVTKNAGGFGRCPRPPGTPIYLDGLLDLPMPAVGEEQRIAIYLEEDIFGSTYVMEPKRTHPWAQMKRPLLLRDARRGTSGLRGRLRKVKLYGAQGPSSAPITRPPCACVIPGTLGSTRRCSRNRSS